MFSGERQQAIRRTEALMQSGPQISALPDLQTTSSICCAPTDYLARLLLQAGCPFPKFMVLAACAGAAVIGFALSQKFFPWQFALLASLMCGYLPVAYLKSQADKRAQLFLTDYPSVLLATASSIKSGMTPQVALERATQLLEADNLLRKEVEKLLAALRRGSKKETAIAAFAANIALPELELFRSGFLLVLENGGRFGPTLERLANVSKDRAVLMRSAQVTSSSMRMTANVLLGMTPLIMLMLSFQIKNFTNTLLHDPTANMLASAGAIVIIGSYALLRKMSAFKP